MFDVTMTAMFIAYITTIVIMIVNYENKNRYYKKIYKSYDKVKKSALKINEINLMLIDEMHKKLSYEDIVKIHEKIIDITDRGD